MSILAIIFVLIFGFFSTDVTAISSTPVVARPTCAPTTTGCVDEVTDASWTTVTIGGVEGVIAPETVAADFGYEGGWVPTVEQVTAAEAAITAEQGELDHDRQYVGFTEDGQQKIFVNGFCDSFDMDWQHTPILVMDGGDCFFGAAYNVETSELEWFSFNGDA